MLPVAFDMLCKVTADALGPSCWLLLSIQLFTRVLTSCCVVLLLQRLLVQGKVATMVGHSHLYASVLAHVALKPLCLQLLLIGDSGVGKSCLLLRFAVRLHSTAPHAVGVICKFLNV